MTAADFLNHRTAAIRIISDSALAAFEHRHVGRAAVNYCGNMIGPLRQRVANLALISVPVVDRHDARFGVIDAQFSDVRRYA